MSKNTFNSNITAEGNSEVTQKAVNQGNKKQKLEENIWGGTIATKDSAKIDQIVKNKIDPHTALKSRHIPEKITGRESEIAMLDVRFLLLGTKAAAPVCRIIAKEEVQYPGEVNAYSAGDYLATGFLLGPGNILMTNHHVIPNLNIAQKLEFQFNYQLDEEGKPTEIRSFYLDADQNESLFCEELDFAVVHLAKSPNQEFGFVPIPNSFKYTIKRCNIIGHPDGQPKQVSLQKNRLAKVQENILLYTTDTMGGSSGSPVFDNDWNLIGLHSRASALEEGYCLTNEGYRMDKILQRWNPSVHNNHTSSS